MQIECSQNTSQGMVMKCKKTNVVVQARGILGVELGNYTDFRCIRRFIYNLYLICHAPFERVTLWCLPYRGRAELSRVFESRLRQTM